MTVNDVISYVDSKLTHGDVVDIDPKIIFRTIRILEEYISDHDLETLRKKNKMQDGTEVTYLVSLLRYLFDANIELTEHDLNTLVGDKKDSKKYDTDEDNDIRTKLLREIDNIAEEKSRSLPGTLGSILSEYREELVYARKRGLTYKEIANLLRKLGICEASIDGIRKHVKRFVEESEKDNG